MREQNGPFQLNFQNIISQHRIKSRQKKKRRKGWDKSVKQGVCVFPLFVLLCLWYGSWVRNEISLLLYYIRWTSCLVTNKKL